MDNNEEEAHIFCFDSLGKKKDFPVNPVVTIINHINEKMPTKKTILFSNKTIVHLEVGREKEKHCIIIWLNSDND
jgi:hypothetical protein